MIEMFRCPICRGGLFFAKPQSVELHGELSNEIRSSSEIKCKQCGNTYSVEDSIPRFVADSGYSSSFGFQWNLHKRTQLDSHSGLTISRDRLFDTAAWPDDMRGKIILEAGSGAGRFTEILVATGALVYSFDYSDAVDANNENNGGDGNLTLFQASIYAIPLAPGTFDKVICLGVIQHTPDPAESFRKLAEMVRQGGELVIDVYARNWLALLQWKYLLRPLTKRMNRIVLYRAIVVITPWLLPLGKLLRRIAGRVGARLIPIVEYSHLGLTQKLNKEWAILDTFDMYSPAHDHPQSISTVRRWFESEGFIDITVRRGQNGVIGRGRKP